MNLFDQILEHLGEDALVLWDAAAIDLPDVGPDGHPESPSSPVLLRVAPFYAVVVSLSWLVAVWHPGRQRWLPRRVPHPFRCYTMASGWIEHGGLCSSCILASIEQDLDVDSEE